MTIHEIDGEALIYDPVSADTHRLNQTALFIWRLCDGRSCAGQIAQRLAEVYDVSCEAALEHVERMLREFQGRSLTVGTDDS